MHNYDRPALLEKLEADGMLMYLRRGWSWTGPRGKKLCDKSEKTASLLQYILRIIIKPSGGKAHHSAALWDWDCQHYPSVL